MVNFEREDATVWCQRVVDRGEVVLWMGERADTWSQMVRWDAPGGQARREASWEADFGDTCAQGWAGVCPGPWGAKLARREGQRTDKSGRVEGTNPRGLSVIKSVPR